MKGCFRAAAPALLVASWCLAGCLEAIRRPAAEPGRGAAWPPPQARVAAEADTAVLRTAGPSRAGADREAVVPPAPVQPPERDNPHRRDLEAVNEYAFWCIGRDLWNEAKLHLEKALQQDSLAASLHNNLGIVHERLGDSTRAAAAYRKARLLSPRNRAYSLNLELLGRRQKAESGEAPQARSDSTVTRARVPAVEADSAGAPPRPRE